MRVTSCLFRLALRGYSVASLPRSFALRARILGRFAPSKFSKKKSVSQSTQNGLKRIKMQKKFFTPLTRFARSERSERRSATLPTPAVASLPRASRFALALLGCFAPSGFALRARYLPYDTPRVPRNVHAKFHADQTKTVGARGIHTHTHTDRHTDSPSFIL